MPLNQTTLQGNIIRDIELKSVGEKNTSLASFTVACSNGKDKWENVVFMNCKAWGKTGEFISTYFQKGSKIIVTGVLKQDEWDDKETGKKRTSFSLDVKEAHFGGDAAKGKKEAPVASKPMGTDEVPF